jgi:hypothetical protein
MAVVSSSGAVATWRTARRDPLADEALDRRRLGAAAVAEQANAVLELGSGAGDGVCAAGALVSL